MDSYEKDHPEEDHSQEAAVAALPPFELEEYREYVDGFDLEEEQKAELVRTVGMIMLTFVDLGFGVDSVQNVLPFLADIASIAEGVEVECEEKSNSQIFEDAALGAAHEER